MTKLTIEAFEVDHPLAWLATFVLLSSCASEPIRPTNEKQEVVLATIRAAEAGDVSSLLHLAGDATVNPMGETAVDHRPDIDEVRELLVPPSATRKCRLDRLQGGQSEDIVSARWECHALQGESVHFRVERRRVVAIEYFAGE